MLHPDEYLGAGQGLAVPTKIIKQADVVMMLNLFKDRYSKQLKRQIGNITSLAPSMVRVLVPVPTRWLRLMLGSLIWRIIIF